MPKYAKGTFIVKDGERRLVLEELGCLRFLSVNDEGIFQNWERKPSSTIWHILELEREGWKEEVAEVKDWEPRPDKVYWYFDDYCIGRSYWSNGMNDLARQATFGVYPTCEAAEAALKVAQDALRKAGMMK